METKDVVTFAISATALTVAIFQFYWNNLRRGRLVYAPPNAHAVGRLMADQGNVFIVLPIVVTNTGSTFKVVNCLWGRLTSLRNTWTELFPMQMELKQLNPTEGAAIATAIPVPPRSSANRIISFSSLNPEVRIDEGDYIFEVFAWEDASQAGQTRLRVPVLISPNTTEQLRNGGAEIFIGHFHPEGVPMSGNRR